MVAKIMPENIDTCIVFLLLVLDIFLIYENIDPTQIKSNHTKIVLIFMLCADFARKIRSK